MYGFVYPLESGIGNIILTALPHIGTETEHETNTQMLLVDGYDYTRQMIRYYWKVWSSLIYHIPCI